jgi:hypothetical protein
MPDHPGRRDGGGDGEAERRAALERRWLDLTRRALPEAAHGRPEWPVRFDHCFQRILLDNAAGGVWYDAIPRRPAYAHAPDALLSEAVRLGEEVLDGRAPLSPLNDRSLAWRGKARRGTPSG